MNELRIQNPALVPDDNGGRVQLIVAEISWIDI